MGKKIGLGIAAAILVIGVTIFAAEGRHFNDLQKEIRTVFKGILSPQQISTLMDFRRDHAEKLPWKTGERPDLFQAWKKLGLSEEQQKQLLEVAGGLVDKTHPDLMAVMETGNELKRKVLEGDPHHPAIDRLSARLGTEIGEVLWNLSLARSQVRSVLTPEQVEILEQHRGKHGLRMKSAVQALPEMAEDLAVLWNELKLTPNQADALEAAHKLITRYRQDQRIKGHDEWRAGLAKILTSEQLALADRFHEKRAAEGGAYFLKMAEERERFRGALGLTGEQKIRLVQMALDRRSQIIPVIQNVLNSAGGLHEQVHADIPDRNSLMAAAGTLGEAIGRAAGLGAGLMADVSAVLTQEQMGLVKEHLDYRLNQHFEHARILPARVHERVDFLDKLALTREQKDQVVKLIAEKHQAKRARRHGMKTLF